MNARWLPILLVASCGGAPSPAPATPVEAAPSPEAPAPAPVVAPEVPAPPAPTVDPAPAATPAPALSPTEALLTTEREAYDRARPVFDKYCTKCHTKGGDKAKPKTLHHFDMTTYPFGGHHAAEVATSVRKVLGVGGKKTMPKDDPGVVEGEELALILAWADAFDRAHAGGAHPTHGDHGKGHKH